MVPVRDEGRTVLAREGQECEGVLELLRVAERVQTEGGSTHRHEDTAPAHVNATAVGRAIAPSGTPRDELFITTELWIRDAGEDNAPPGA